MKKNKPLVGISQCLLGDAVRYDGKSKANKIVLEKLNDLFEFVPVCPEVEAGLGIPRPPVQLTGSINDPRLTGRDNPAIDITDIMQTYCKQKPAELKNLSGFIFKSRSPSCGLNSTPVFIKGHCVTENSRGIFAKKLCNFNPHLPVIEESEFEACNKLDNFIQAVINLTATQTG
jgi:uncharacterized protein YbbK (DUF523 family)